MFTPFVPSFHRHRRSHTWSRRRNRPLTVAGPSQAQPINNLTPRAREELVPHIITITEVTEQVISAQETPVIQDFNNFNLENLLNEFNNLNLDLEVAQDPSIEIRPTVIINVDLNKKWKN